METFICAAPKSAAQATSLLRNLLPRTREFEISGPGKIFAREAPGGDAEAEINGSGDIEMTATKTLDATTNGSGKIKYWGDATVKTNISGSGEVEGH